LHPTNETRTERKRSDKMAQAAVFHQRSDLHILRKIWHMGIGGLALVAYHYSGLSHEAWVNIALGAAIWSFCMEMLRFKFPAVNKFIMGFMGPFMRDSEKTSLTGFPFYALGVGLSLLLFNERIAILSVFFLVFADPISSFIGITFGKNKIAKSKSLQGAIAGFFVCYLISLIYGLVYAGPSFNLLIFSLFGGVVGTISELLSIYVDDNLTIPVVSGLGLSLLNVILQIF